MFTSIAPQARLIALLGRGRLTTTPSALDGTTRASFQYSRSSLNKAGVGVLKDSFTPGDACTSNLLRIRFCLLEDLYFSDVIFWSALDLGFAWYP